MRSLRRHVLIASSAAACAAALVATVIFCTPGAARAADKAKPSPAPTFDIARAAKVLFRGPVVQRVTSDGVTIMGKPVEALIDEKITVTVTPEDAKPGACRADAPTEKLGWTIGGKKRGNPEKL